MRGTVKFFDRTKGWGFITSEEGTDYFVHYSAIQGRGFRFLDANDIVLFDVKECERGWQAINVERILTIKMVEDALKKDNLFLQIAEDDCGVCFYRVVDESDNPVVEEGMTLIEVAAYSGIYVEGITEEDVSFANKFAEQLFAKQITDATTTLVTAEIVTDAIKKVMDEKKEDIMSKNFEEKYSLVVKTVTQESEEDIVSKYRKACEHFENMATDDKGVLEEIGINMNDTSDLPTVIEAVGDKWSTYDPLKKSAVARAIAGEESAHDVMVYFEAMDYMKR